MIEVIGRFFLRCPKKCILSLSTWNYQIPPLKTPLAYIRMGSNVVGAYPHLKMAGKDQDWVKMAPILHKAPS